RRYRTPPVSRHVPKGRMASSAPAAPFSAVSGRNISSNRKPSGPGRWPPASVAGLATRGSRMKTVSLRVMGAGGRDAHAHRNSGNRRMCPEDLAHPRRAVLEEGQSNRMAQGGTRDRGGQMTAGLGTALHVETGDTE